MALGLQGLSAIVASTLWTGNIDTGNWARSVDVAASAFGEAAEGSVITIDFNVNESYGKLELNTSEFDMLDAQSTLTNLNALKEFDKTATTTSATLSARDAARLKRAGLKIIGEFLTITRIEMSAPSVDPDNPDNPDEPYVEPEFPVHLYIADSSDGRALKEMTKVGTCYYADDVKIDCPGFVLTTITAPTWEEINRRRHFGAESDGLQLTDNTPATIVDYNGNASPAKPWSVAAGFYSVAADLKEFTITATRIPSSIRAINAETPSEAEYYSISGIRVAEPTAPGLYIRRSEGKCEIIAVGQR